MLFFTKKENRMQNDMSYEDVKSTIMKLLWGELEPAYELNQWTSLLYSISKHKPNTNQIQLNSNKQMNLTANEESYAREIFWGLFSSGIITLGINESNPNFPFFQLTLFGKKQKQLSKSPDLISAYISNDIDVYERSIKQILPNIDKTTMLYLNESMKAFRANCFISSTIMLGVAAEHLFTNFEDTISSNKNSLVIFKKVFEERNLYNKLDKISNIFPKEKPVYQKHLRESVEYNFLAIGNTLRAYRNDAGHPTGKEIDRDQLFVLLHLFVKYAESFELLKDHYK
jgi:hypothetical protein